MRRADGVLLTGVYGSGQSSVAEEITYLLEQRGEPYALLDLDYLSWAGTGTDNRAAEFGLMLQNLAAVTANYRRAGIRFFVLAYLSAAPARCRAYGKLGAAAAGRAPDSSADRHRAAAGQRYHQRSPRLPARGSVIYRGGGGCWRRRYGHQRRSHRGRRAGCDDFPRVALGCRSRPSRISASRRSAVNSSASIPRW